MSYHQVQDQDSEMSGSVGKRAMEVLIDIRARQLHTDWPKHYLAGLQSGHLTGSSECQAVFAFPPGRTETPNCGPRSTKGASNKTDFALHVVDRQPAEFNIDRLCTLGFMPVARKILKIDYARIDVLLGFGSFAKAVKSSSNPPLDKHTQQKATEGTTLQRFWNHARI